MSREGPLVRLCISSTNVVYTSPPPSSTLLFSSALLSSTLLSSTLSDFLGDIGVDDSAINTLNNAVDAADSQGK